MAERKSRNRALLGVAAALVVPAGLVGVSMLPSNAAAAPTAGSTYQLVVKKSGKCLDVPAASTASGALLQQWGCSPGAAWQQFKLVAAGGNVLLQNVNSGMCLDVPAGSKSSGQRLQQWGCAGSQTNQQWRVAASGADTFQIINVNSGLCVSDQGASTASGASIIQETCTANSNKQWAFTPVTGSGATPAPTATATTGAFTVASDGSGTYRTVQAAIDAVGAGNAARKTITIKPGTYREIVTIPANKPFITLQGGGDSSDDVVIVNNRSNAGGYGTSGSATLFANGKEFNATNLTISNDYGEGSQAVAANLNADRLVFDNVRFLGAQDTLLVNSGRAYVKGGYVEGTVDFIFGGGTAVFEGTKIYQKRISGGPITAAKTDAGNAYGFLFYKSTVTGVANNVTQLGRPWGPNAQVVFRECDLSATIRTAQPWTDMSSNSWKNARFFEYANRGPGATTNSNRPQMSATTTAGVTSRKSAVTAAAFTPQKFLAGSDGWNPATPAPAAAPTATSTTAPAASAGRAWASAPDGFASTGGGTTGGAAGATVTVSSLADLTKYVTATEPYVIKVAGAITITPKGTELKVTSNKTIVGAGTSGEIVGGGFFLGAGVRNVIIRNLTIRDTEMTEDDPGDKTYDYDAIQMDTADHIWIDHNKITRMNDGMIDSRKDTTYLTVSWNILDDGNKAFGIGWTDNVTARMTIHHNWIKNTSQRNPSTDNVAYAHLYNNYLQNITSYGNLSRGGTKMVLENSYFDKVANPYNVDDLTKGQLKQSGSIVMNSTGKQVTNGPAFTPSSFYPYTLDAAADVPALLGKYAGPQANIGN
ncbi:pectinesterase family protein [Actinoplanes sp. NEAU-A12]|uniref:Pectinesterase family protein n=1 Tax=Actinoplanes sandaracinus TaxID=3045177 RepID=A0ABT6WQH0_9ACTN|nr:pectinesterase family protein [Actinoplanes sandaracinus]MDI6101970.1 pectinesterase family protein [Actinoplanes sandaracinus]